MEARASELPRIGEDQLFPSTPARLFEQARVRPDAPAYKTHDGSGWKAASWKDYAETTRRAARALVALGVQPDDTVAILGYNRPEWTTMAIAAMAARAAGGRVLDQRPAGNRLYPAAFRSACVSRGNRRACGAGPPAKGRMPAS